jgi:hypothetical protein
MRWGWLLLLGACTPNFADPTTVQDLRLLDVSADLPETIVDVGPLAQLDAIPDAATVGPLLAQVATTLPDSFPTITLRALLIDPRGQGRPVHVKVVSCVNAVDGQSSSNMMGMAMGMAAGRIRDTIDRDPCPGDAPVLADSDASAGPDGVVPFAVPLTITRPLLLAAITADPLGVVFGLPLTVQFTASAGDEQVVVRKRVVFVPRLSPEQTPNRNPVIPTLTLRLSEDDPGVAFNLMDPLAAPPEVSLGAKVAIEPAPGDAETYLTKVLERGTNHLTMESATEALRFAFYATAGDFGPGATTTDPNPVRTPPLHPLATTYHAPARMPEAGDVVNVWVVTRDERAGSSWIQVALKLVP